MPRTCTVCASTDLEAIDQAIVCRESKRGIARRYGVSADAVERHAAIHLPKALVKATEAKVVAHADDLLGTARRVLCDALEILENTEADGNPGGSLQAIDRIHKGIALLATLAQSDATQFSHRYAIAWLGDGDCPLHPNSCGCPSDATSMLGRAR